MTVLQILIYIAMAFVGYVIGRFGHCYLNVWLKDPKWAPDHWIYGIILMFVGLFLFEGDRGLMIFSFGLGHFISDIKDFFKLKFFGLDKPDQKKFWGID